MTNHAAFAAEDAVTAVSPPAQASLHFSLFPPRMASDCKKAALGRMDLAASGVLREGSLVDSMKASSPRYAKFAAAADHEDWMEKHPLALEWFEAVQAAAKGNQIVMFLDYDGTLSPIVEDPESAIMTEDMRDAVRSVSQNFPTAIVSGRGRDKVHSTATNEELYYAGSHGMDIKRPTTVSNHKAKADEVLCQPATEFLPVIQEVYEALTAKMESIPGAMVENNKFCLSVHFRCVDEKEWDVLGEEVRAVLEGYPDLCLTKGRKVLEIRPSIKWDKGNALEFLLESLGYAGRGDVFLIYIGDDRTDEDAFKVLRDMGQGIGVLVTKFPKETTASYSLREPAEVKDFLRKLVKSSVTKG
ncbi:probable trehalose-phosphate phosphatase 3 [Lolium rigidum]|uniref:probable trehalose-phosphate phosphatase 3 n=1 Tax=Lolium rigidum TaxID=89674 RepID=UPI001F5DDA3F|nr:probable trehalose-phosphate phosphatase 3 [Lolium rigidum]